MAKLRCSPVPPYPIGFDSTIPELLGLPPLADNKAEGIAIKPMQSIEVETKKGRLRPVWLALGSLVCYTRLVEEFALQKGSPVKILCASDIIKNPKEPDDPGEDWNTIIWQNNPYVEEIIDANKLDPAIMNAINPEFDNFCQSRHEIINLCAPYNLRPRQLRGSLFLSFEEMQWGLRSLRDLKRPVICLCPYGTSSSLPESPWYLDKWLLLVETLK